MPKRYIRGDKVISYTTPPPVLLVLRRKPLTPLDSYSHQGSGRRQYRQKMPRWCSEMLIPNITGTIEISDAYFSSATGACRQGEATTSWAGAQGSASHIYSVSLDSSRINSIYSGNELQPKAIQALIIIKTWAAGGWTVFVSLNNEFCRWTFAEIFQAEESLYWVTPPAVSLDSSWKMPVHPIYLA